MSASWFSLPADAYIYIMRESHTYINGTLILGSAGRPTGMTANGSPGVRSVLIVGRYLTRRACRLGRRSYEAPARPANRDDLPTPVGTTPEAGHVVCVSVSDKNTPVTARHISRRPKGGLTVPLAQAPRPGSPVRDYFERRRCSNDDHFETYRNYPAFGSPGGKRQSCKGMFRPI